MNPLLALARAGRTDAPDSQLLARFHAGRDDTAFAELVRRHGPVVWGVCRRSFSDPVDAEDAFQATFLIFVSRTERLRNHPAIGPWLYRVATLTVRNLRRANSRRAAVAGRLDQDVPVLDPATDRTDARLDLDAALAGLPDKYRTPVVLCHLQGLTRREAAARLGCPEGTLSAVLAEALRKLRVRLGGRDPAAMLVAVGGSLVPAELTAATVRLARAVSLSNLTATGVRPVVTTLTRQGLCMGIQRKAALAATAIVVSGLVLGLVVATVRPGPAPERVAADMQEKPTTTAPEFLAAPGGPRVRDVWHLYTTSDGKRYGSIHTQVVRLPDGNYRMTEESRQLFDLDALGKDVVEERASYVITPAYRPVSFEIEGTQSSGTTRATGRLRGEQFEVTIKVAGLARSVTFDAAGQVVLSPFLDDWLADRPAGFKQGEV